MPNVTAVNVLGDYYIAADRLAIIDGEGQLFAPPSKPWVTEQWSEHVVDPWRPDTPHADEALIRPDTTLRPFKVIPGKPDSLLRLGVRC